MIIQCQTDALVFYICLGAGATAVIYICHARWWICAGEEGIAKREHMGFPHPPPAQQHLAWERVLALFDKHLKN